MRPRVLRVSSSQYENKRSQTNKPRRQEVEAVSFVFLFVFLIPCFRFPLTFSPPRLLLFTRLISYVRAYMCMGTIAVSGHIRPIYNQETWSGSVLIPIWIRQAYTYLISFFFFSSIQLFQLLSNKVRSLSLSLLSR